MDSPPQVSVIIIFLNAERFLAEAIESVFAQSYQHWELLLVDDGSIDGSTAIALDYARCHPGRVRYLEHPGHVNRGMSAARNLGIRYAAGTYLAFLDADDVWLPEKLARQVRILGSHPEAAMVYGPSEWWYSWTGDPADQGRDFKYELGLPTETLVEPPLMLTQGILRQVVSLPCTCSVLIRREATWEVGGFEDRFRNTYEDQAFFAKLFLRYPIYVSKESFDRYRQHPESCMAVVQRNNQERMARLYFLNWLADYMTEQNIRDKQMWHLLHKQIRQQKHPWIPAIQQSTRQIPGTLRGLCYRALRQVLPLSIRQQLGRLWREYRNWPPAGWVRFGNLRRVDPINREWGLERGQPIDRYYIEHFLNVNRAAIRGHVLEIGESTYTHRFGGTHVTQSDVLHVSENDPQGTIVGDLTSAAHIPDDSFDCVILTQTLQFIYDLRGALTTVERILRPGGVLLATVPGISQISRYDMDRWGDYWRFTTRSARRLLEEHFPADAIHVEAYGNVLAATAFLYGLATHELRRAELDTTDPDYELLITIRARKPAVTSTT